MKHLYSQYQVYNHTFSSKKKIFFPNKINKIVKLLKDLKRKNIKPLILSGGCGHGDKSFLKKNDYLIYLNKFNKILKIDKKKNIIKVQAGVKLIDLQKFLEKRNFFIYNISGGRTVSVAGAITGNVHGRPQSKNYCTFGDNVTYLKYLDKDLKIKKINRSNANFKKFIGSFGLNGIIIEAGLKIFKLKFKSYFKIENKVIGKNNFDKLDRNHDSFYGYINYFNKKRFIGNFIYFLPSKKLSKRNIQFDLFKFLNYFKLDFLASFFINKYTLRILYFLLFNIKNINMNRNLATFKESIYFVNINTYLPFFFRKGMIEIQFSIKKNKLFKIIDSIKNKQNHNNIFPFFFILKKMNSTKEKYFFNFPKYNYCISLGYPKAEFLKKKHFFEELYKIFYENDCNLYLTKDETVMDIDNKYKDKLKKKIKFNNIISNEFYEKMNKK